MGTTEYRQVAFMPWADLQREVVISEVRFWPFHSQKERLIPDGEIRSYLERYFSRHVDHRGRAAKTVTVASIGEVSFEPLDDIARRRIRQAADALLFASVLPGVKAGVCANNQSWPQLNADTFQLVFQSFEPGSDHIAVQSGPALSGGWRLDEITFPMPWTARTSTADSEEELLSSLGAVLDPHFDSAKRQRVFRALEWFRLSHTDVDEVSDPNRLVMMATAFEIVLQFPRWNGKKKEFFVDQIQRIVAGSRLDAPSSNLSIVAGKWAGDFYKLRGDIVHGEPCKQPRSDLPRVDYPSRCGGSYFLGMPRSPACTMVSLSNRC